MSIFQIESAKEELALLRESNNRSSKEIEENAASIAGLEEDFVQRKARLKHLEYDVNVIEKEGRKLARELEKVLRIQITEAEVHHHQIPDNLENDTNNPVGIDDSVDSSVDMTLPLSSSSDSKAVSHQGPPSYSNSPCQTTRPASDGSVTAADLAEAVTERCLITGSPSSSGNSSDSKSSFNHRDRNRSSTGTPDLPDLGDSFLLSSPDMSPRGAVGPPLSGNLRKPIIHARMSALVKSSVSSGAASSVRSGTAGRADPGDPEAENSDTGLSSLHSSSDEATLDFGTLV